MSAIEEYVAKIRGGYDVPAFDICVKAETQRAKALYQEYIDEGSTDVPAHEWLASAMSFDEFCKEHYQTRDR